MESPSSLRGTHVSLDQRLVVTIGCCVALGFVCIAALVLVLLRPARDDQIRIHRHLVLNLLLAEFVFVVGINQTHLGGVCSAVAALLQYFLLVTLAWTFFEGFYLYNSLVESVEMPRSKFACYASLAYIAPAVVTGVSMLIDPASFGTERYCWLRADNYFIFSFIAPMVGVMFVSIAILFVTDALTDNIWQLVIPTSPPLCSVTDLFFPL